MKILIYGLNYAPELIGVGRYTGEIGDYLSASGHEIYVVTAPPHYPGWAVKPPYNAWAYKTEFKGRTLIWRCPILLKAKMHGIWRLLAPLSFALSSAPLVLWTIFRHRPDLVFCVEPTLFATPVAILGAKIIRARTILHVQDLEVDAAFAVGHLKGRWAQKFAHRIEAAMLRRFDNLVAISNKMRERLVAKGVPPERISLIRNWTDLDAIRPLEGDNSFRAALGLTKDAFIVLYAGSIGAKQALHLVLEVAARFAAIENPPVFVIAGEGPAKATLQSRYGHLPHIRFLPLQPEEKLCELLNLADLHILPQEKGIADLVLPSKLGGMLASGKPILVMADQGTELHDVLEGTAILVPAGDTMALEREIARAGREAHHGGGEGQQLAKIFAREGRLSDMEACILPLAGTPPAQRLTLKIDIWHNLLWSRYKGGVFSKLHELAQERSIEVRFFQIAEVDADRIGLSPVDLEWHTYPYELLFKGSYAKIPKARLLWELAKRTWRSDADIMILAGYEKPEYWLQAAINLLRRKKYAVFCDSTIHDRPQHVLKGLLKRLFFKLCDGIFCYGQRSGDYVRAYGAKPEKIFTRCQAAALFKHYDAEAILNRRVEARRTDNLRYLYVGRLASEKCVDDLLRAFARVSERRPEAELILVGTGPQGETLKALAHELGIAKSVNFAGARYDEDLIEEYLKASCLVLPSRSEPWGLVVNEALSCGCPVVVSNRCGCVPELVIAGKTGFDFEHGNVKDLAQTLMRVPEVFADRAAFARNCIDHIAPFSTETAARNILDGCVSMLSRSRDQIAESTKMERSKIAEM